MKSKETLSCKSVGRISTQVMFDHLGTEETSGRPVAFLVTPEGLSASVEAIDIVRTIEQNPMTIRHPILGFAVESWIRFATDPRFLDRGFMDSKKLITASSQNLKRIGHALATPPRDPNYGAIRRVAEFEGADLDSSPNYLRIAWERLASKFIVETDEADQRVLRVEDYLRQIPTALTDLTGEYEVSSNNRTWNMEHGLVATNPNVRTVILFLRETGSEFVYSEKSFRNPRPSWRVFKSAFLAWRIGIRPATAITYRKRAKRSETIHTEELNLNEYLHDLMISSLSIPLALFVEPFTCPLTQAQSLTSLQKQLQRKLNTGR